MRVIALIQEKQERSSFKSLMTVFSSLAFPEDLKTFNMVMTTARTIDFFVLDERVGDTKKALEAIADLSSEKTPLILVLINERNPGVDGFFEEAQRLETYKELGVESFLHRPFGHKQLQEKIAECTQWLTKTPPWLQLMRAGRALVRAKQDDKALETLRRIHEIKPDDLDSISLLAKALIRSGGEHLNEALKILDPSRLSKTALVLLRKERALALQGLGRTTEAFNEALSTFLLIPTIDNLSFAYETSESLPVSFPKAKTWLETINSIKPDLAENEMILKTMLWSYANEQELGPEAELMAARILAEHGDINSGINKTPELDDK